MKSLINIYNTTANFWEVNPKFKSLDVFKTAYTKDKSSKKKSSSLDMWIVCSFLEPESPYVDIAEDPDDRNGQARLISRDLTGNENWWYANEERLKPLKERYLFFLETPASRSLRRWERKLVERDKVLDETPYEVGITNEKGQLCHSNVAILDKMLVDTTKVWEQYQRILEMLSEESNSGGVKGSGLESLSDIGEI